MTAPAHGFLVHFSCTPPCNMWRSFFLALGIMAIIVGIECLLIDSANLYAASDTTAKSFINPSQLPAQQTKVWQPKEWFPWLTLCAGAITVLYAFSLPRRWRSEG